MPSEASFDVVSRIDQQELDNALNQARREIENRFDFKHSRRRSSRADEKKITVVSDDEMKMRNVIDIVQSKAVKRGIDIKAFEFGDVEPAAGQHRAPGRHAAQRHPERQEQGADGEDQSRSSSKSTRSIRTSRFASRGKSRDDLQKVIAELKAMEFELPLQFVNYR